jgi:AcrR family transcriptional regulator
MMTRVTETSSAPRTARERARAELTAEILETARRHLEADGAAALSLRAVARDLGMVSSAVYRYVPSRDDLLTRLIIDAYNALGDAVDVAEAACGRDDFLGRWLALGHATRDWACAHPQEWALIYGSPVPGYAAPPDTVGPGTRVSATMTQILGDAAVAGRGPQPEPVPDDVAASLGPLREFVGNAVPDSWLVRGVMARTQLFGHIGLELDGQFNATIDDLRAFFDHVLHLVARDLGLTD